jgi:pilus assembly protein Flp/PilA
MAAMGRNRCWRLTMNCNDLAARTEENPSYRRHWGVQMVNLEGTMRQLMKLLRNVRGASAIEYALVASLISIAGILAMTNLGNKINIMYNNVSNHLN